MSKLIPTLLLMVTVAAAAPGQAHDSDACLPMEDGNTPVCLHYFEGSSVDVPVREAIDSIDEKCEHLVVSILQRQGLLLAPLGEPLEFDAQDCMTMTSIALDLPDVRSETDLLLQFAPKESENGQGDELNDAAAVIALRVYPDTLLDPLSRFAERHSLIVFDDEGALTDFLDQQEIEYVRGYEAVSGVPIGLLVNADEPERILEDRGIETAVIFQEKIVDLPQVRTVSHDGRTRVYVEMPFLHDLHSNPLAQKALLNIIRLAINPNPFDRG